MKLFNIFKYDIRRGLLENPSRFLVISLFAAILFFSFSLDTVHRFWFDPAVNGSIQNINSIGISFGDVILTQIGGILPINFNNISNGFTFPMKWILPHLTIQYYLLNYASADLRQEGIQILIRSKSKQAWWVSKCAWAAISTLTYYFLEMALIALICWITGKDMNLSINPIIFTSEFDSLPSLVNENAGKYFVSFCVMPCLIGITIGIVQMVLTLYIKPIFAYLITCAYYITGIYYPRPFFISNYAMAVRSSMIGICNFSTNQGIIICLIVIIFSMLIGRAHLRKIDIINNI